MKRNRVLVLAAIPLAFAASMAASSQRFVDRWLTTFPAIRVDPGADDRVRLAGENPYDEGSYDVTFGPVDASRVTAVVNDPGDEPEPVEVPAGLALWRIAVDVQMSPTAEAGPCTFVVLDAKDRKYSAGTSTLPGAPPVTSACTPFLEDDEVRPPRFTRHFHVVMPEDVEPAAVRLFYYPPRYAQFDLSPS